MSEYTVQDFIREAEKQEQFYRDQIAKFDKILSDYEIKRSDLLKRKDIVLDSIVKKFVPELNTENLKKFSLVFNHPEPLSYIEDMNKEKELLKKKILEIENNNEFKKREALTHPEHGVIVTQINEIKPIYESAKEIYDKINSFSYFKILKERNYGTDLYPYKGLKKYFIPQFYQDWKNADIIVEELKVNNFIDVLNLYDQASNQVKNLGSALEDYENQILKIKNLEREYEESKYKLENIENFYYKKLKDIVYNFYKTNDKTLLLKVIESNKDIEEQFKAIDGIDHQIEYLQKLYEKVSDDRNKLVNKAGRLAEETSKYKLNAYKYRNKRFSETDFQKKFSRDEERFNKMYDKYDRYGNTIYVFNDYGRSSLLTDFLWWDLITDGRLDGNFIPEVNEYYSTHPEYSEDISSYSYDQS